MGYLISILFLTGGIVGCFHMDRAHGLLLVYSIISIIMAPVVILACARINEDDLKKFNKLKVIWSKISNFIWMIIWGVVIYKGYTWTGFMGECGVIAAFLSIGMIEVHKKTKLNKDKK